MTVGRHMGRIGPAGIAGGLALLMTFALSFGSVALAAPSASSKSLYIVQMAGAPIAAYAGDIKGLEGDETGPGQEGRHAIRPRQRRTPATSRRTGRTCSGSRALGDRRGRVHLRRHAQWLRGEV